MRHRSLPWWTTALALFGCAVFFAFVLRSFQQLSYDWNFTFLGEYLWNAGAPGLILKGLWCTLWMSFVSIVFGTLLGIVVGLLLLTREPVSRWFAVVYVEVMRNTPVLVQLYVAYFVIGTALHWTPEFAGVTTLSLFCAAYVAEIFRGTIQNLDKGQWDAGKSIGLRWWDIARDIIAPQALRRMIPALVGQFVSLVKDSSLVSVIAINELTKAAINVVAFSFRSFETWFLIALCYLIVNFVLSQLGRWLEYKLSAERFA